MRWNAPRDLLDRWRVAGRPFHLSAASETSPRPSLLILSSSWLSRPTISAHLAAGNTDFPRCSKGCSYHCYSTYCTYMLLLGWEEWRSRARSDEQVLDSWCYRRPLPASCVSSFDLRQHGLRAQQVSCPSRPSSPNCYRGLRGVGMARRGQATLVAFGASSSASKTYPYLVVWSSVHLGCSCACINYTWRGLLCGDGSICWLTSLAAVQGPTQRLHTERGPQVQQYCRQKAERKAQDGSR